MDKRTAEAKILSWAKTAQKNHKAISLLLEIFEKPLYWHIRKMVISHDDTRDVLQEVFLRAWKNIRGFKKETGLSTWMYRIATNETLRFLEKKRNLFEKKQKLEAILARKLDEMDLISGDKIQIQLQKAVLKLPEKQRLVFNMRYFDDMKYEEIAEILETTINSTKVNYHHAKTKIEQLLKEEILL